MDDLIFRRAKPSDYPYLIDLAKQIGYPITLDEAKIRLRTITKLKDDIFIVAELFHEVVGFVHGITIIEVLTPKTLRLGGLVVNQYYRKYGIGRKLMKELEKFAKENKYSMIIVPTNIKRLEAHKFYTKIGYKNEKTQFIFFKHL